MAQHFVNTTEDHLRLVLTNEMARWAERFPMCTTRKHELSAPDEVARLREKFEVTMFWRTGLVTAICGVSILVGCAPVEEPICTDQEIEDKITADPDWVPSWEDCVVIIGPAQVPSLPDGGSTGTTETPSTPGTPPSPPPSPTTPAVTVAEAGPNGAAAGAATPTAATVATATPNGAAAGAVNSGAATGAIATSTGASAGGITLTRP